MLIFLFKNSTLFKCMSCMLKNKNKIQIQQWTSTHSPKIEKKNLSGMCLECEYGPRTKAEFNSKETNNLWSNLAWYMTLQ